MRVMLAQSVPAVGGVGGQERHVLSLARRLGKTGHRVALVVPSRDPGRSRLGDGVELVRLGALFPYAQILYRTLAIHPQCPDPLLVPSLRRFMREWQPDIVHSHGLVLFSVGPALRGPSIPWVHTLHDYGLICPKESLWRLPERAVCRDPLTLACIPCHSRDEPVGPLSPFRAVASLAGLAVGTKALPRPDLAIAVSEFVAKAHQCFLPPMADRTRVIPNFLDGEKVSISPKDLPEQFVLFAGSAAANKGLHVLLKAVRATRPDVWLVVMATGPRKWLDGLQRTADHRIVFYRNAPHPVVMTAWERCLFGVIPSLWPDPCPTVALEAMSRGKPVVASAVGGLTSIVMDGETGILVPPGDVEALRQALCRLIGDGRSRRRMGQAARERLRSGFSAEAVVPEIEEAYLQLQKARPDDSE